VDAGVDLDVEDNNDETALDVCFNIIEDETQPDRRGRRPRPPENIVRSAKILIEAGATIQPGDESLGDKVMFG